MAGLCGQGCRAGREGEPLASSVYLEAEMVARPSCGGHFHAGANRMGSAALCPSPSSLQHASDVGRDLVLLLSLDVPAQQWNFLSTTAGELEPGEGH